MSNEKKTKKNIVKSIKSIRNFSEKPKIPKIKDVGKKYIEFLARLETSGICNMYSAAPFLVQEFPELDVVKAQHILLNWLDQKNITIKNGGSGIKK